jgi:predicted PurR-regulated permease PerM
MSSRTEAAKDEPGTKPVSEPDSEPLPPAKASAVTAELRRPQVTFKTVVVATLAVLLVAVVGWALSAARFALALTGLAMLIAVAVDHVVKLLERWGVRRMLAIALVFLLGLALATGVALLVIPAAVTQATALFSSVPHLVGGFRDSRIFHKLDGFLHIKADLDDPSGKLAQLAKSQASSLMSLVGGVLTGISGAVVITFLTIFMLVFGGPLIDTVVAESRPGRRPIYEEVIHKIHNALGGYVIGLVIICSINATLTTIFLAINHTPFFLPLGILSGMSSLIPYAGPFVAGVTVSAIALGTGGAGHGIAAGVYFVLYGQLEGNVLGPLIFRRAVHANPLLVTLSILFLSEIGGILGAVAAVPLLAVLQIIVGEILRVRRAGLARQSAAPSGQPDVKSA